MTPDWRGVFPALPTQFKEDLSVDLDATASHLEGMIDAGVHGMVMLGTIGENNSLTAEEKRDVLRAAVEAARGRVPVLAGVSEFTTATACRYAADAEKIGVDGLMVLPGIAYRADPREAVAHYRAVAAATGLPILCYNNPKVYGVDLAPEAFVELADVENIVAIKEATGDPRRITDIINAVGDRYILFAGLDDVVLESVMLGAVGTVFGVVNGFPAETVYLWELAQQGEWEKAREIYRWFMPLLHLDDHPKLVQYMKLLSQECGYGSERVRPPRLALVGEERQRVLAMIHRAIDTRPSLPVAAA
ncbi:MAG TPA: dihydrodipicolinate synthase family protein [Longimicrobiales bacterium]